MYQVCLLDVKQRTATRSIIGNNIVPKDIKKGWEETDRFRVKIGGLKEIHTYTLTQGNLGREGSLLIMSWA